MKATKDFTPQERGKEKYAYYQSNVFWIQVSRMIRSGYTVDRAIEKIYSVYGHMQPVTKILFAMIKDKKIGGHPELRDRVV